MTIELRNLTNQPISTCVRKNGKLEWYLLQPYAIIPILESDLTPIVHKQIEAGLLRLFKTRSEKSDPLSDDIAVIIDDEN